MTRAEVVARALSQPGRKTVYKLGTGGMHPEHDRPSDAAFFCDCSGFAWWCWARSRYDGKKWWDTSAIQADAMADHGDRIFTYHAWNEAQLGDALVWGDKAEHQGHIGIVTAIDSNGPARVTHCSKGHWTSLGDAIAESDPGIFKANDAIVVRPTWITA